MPVSRPRRAILTALLLAATPALAASSAAAAAPPPVTISPAAGTPDASATTQVSILGVRPSAIRGVTVRGSSSGSHSGSLHAYSGQRGASWLTSKPFTAGESVSAVIRVAGRAAITRRFSIGRVEVAPPVLSANVPQLNKLDHFASEPLLLAPKITVLKPGRASTGDLFLTPLPSPEVHPGSNNELTIKPVGPGGPMIIDGNGRLVWFHQLLPPEAAANFRPQTYLGKQVLTWWQGTVTIAAYGSGEGVIADTHYRTIKVVHAGNGYQADLHEFTLTSSGDALFTIYQLVAAHLPGTPAGTRSPLLDSIVQEVDVRTGLVTWEWHSLGHIPLADTYVSRHTSVYFDAFHLNSIEPLPGGRMLVSARDTSSIYDIDQASGRIVWTLGGKASSFRLGHGARFYFQHDAQMLPGNRVSLYDDEGGPPVEAPASRGLVLALDSKRHTASVAHQYLRPGAPTQANSQGSTQTLPNGDVLVGYGAAPNFSEFSSSGKLVFDARVPIDDGSYRVFRYPWQTTPATKPALAVKRLSVTGVQVSASWNGATNVARWRVLAGTSTEALHSAAEHASTGFETAIPVTTTATTFEVQALDAKGRVLVTSASATAS
jgi:hypothetical protein